MGKVGRVLRAVLQDYGISQNRLAIALDVRPSVVYRWVSERTDPTGETILRIVESLKGLDDEAAKSFVDRYLGEVVDPPSEL